MEDKGRAILALVLEEAGVLAVGGQSQVAAEVQETHHQLHHLRAIMVETQVAPTTAEVVAGVPVRLEVMQVPQEPVMEVMVHHLLFRVLQRLMRVEAAAVNISLLDQRGMVEPEAAVLEQMALIPQVLAQ